MRLNLPHIAALDGARSVLVAGMGGGFDVFCGLPIRHALREAGKTVHLANLSFTDLKFIKGTVALAPGVVGVQADYRTVLQYAPEWHLARYLRDTEDDTSPVWCFGGDSELAARPLLRAYQALLEHLKPDVLLLIDGGVDSLMRGDEAEVGTIFEDSVSLAAVSQLPADMPQYLACLGMGAENDITYAHVLENIAALAENGGLLGTCSLTRQMESYQAYEKAVEYVHAQKFQEPSVIQSSVVSAVQGHFGNYHATERTRKSRLHISPLMPLYWFFEAKAVIERSLVVPHLLSSETRREAMQSFALIRSALTRRATPLRTL
jgi:hypothetical protein